MGTENTNQEPQKRKTNKNKEKKSRKVGGSRANRNEKAVKIRVGTRKVWRWGKRGRKTEKCDQVTTVGGEVNSSRLKNKSFNLRALGGYRN